MTHPSAPLIENYTPAGQQAIAELNELCGFDIREVLHPDDWQVVLLDEGPTVVCTARAMRALAVFSPREDADEIAEEIIKEMEDGS